MKKVYIDGGHGTTGLKIHDRLSQRKDIELIQIPYVNRHDLNQRKEALNSADIVFLCLPDDASKEAVSLITNKNTVVIDTSTAHRTHSSWVYGMAELSGYREQIRCAKRISNPGCHATGFIALIAPLIESGLINKDLHLSMTSITGYSGGGKRMIDDYEENHHYPAPRLYSLDASHKHLLEMKKICSLKYLPSFMPIVSNYYSGMETIIPLFKKDLNGSIEDIKKIYQQIYQGPIIKYFDHIDDYGYISATSRRGSDDMHITVAGNSDRIMLIACFDNLGKGASGAAIQNMNIVLGIKETEGLELGG